MQDYQKDVLIDELQLLLVSKSIEIKIKDNEIQNLKSEIERLEKKLTPPLPSFGYDE